MQKVEGSSPFIRSSRPAGNGGFFVGVVRRNAGFGRRTILVAQRVASRRRAYSGLFLTFLLSFVNLVGIVFTLIALGGLEPWSPWQFIGAFGVLEAASGLANVISPNIWRLPVAQVQTSERTEVELAGS